MAVKFSNNAVTTLSADISAGATSFTVASASTFPTLGASDWTYVSLTSEVVKVTAISGTTFTCDATSGAHSSGATVELRMTSELLNDVALGDDESLDAISNASAITGNAVDVFIYDTSNDSDGGAWRKRTQATSWYNETLNTSTRGSRKEFPSVAVIVAEANKVTIYDGDTPDLDMWMVFVKTTPIFGRSNAWGNISSCSMLNGTLVFGNSSSSAEAVLKVNFISDNGFLYPITSYSSYGGAYTSDIASRANSYSYGTSGTTVVVDAPINDVAMTVLPNAPIDSTTGLPIPTIAVATDGGVSVIKDDGTVVDLVSATDQFGEVHFINNKLVVQWKNGDIFQVGDIPSADVSTGNLISWQTEYYRTDISITDVDLALLGNNVSSGVGGESLFHAAAEGLTLLKRNTTTPSEGSVAYLTSTYNSGYMTGDIKGAWLSDTDTTNVVGGELVSNGTFDTDTTGWTNLAVGTVTVTSGVVRVTRAGNQDPTIYQAFSTVVGETYTVSSQHVSTTAVSTTRILSGTGSGTILADSGFTSVAGIKSVTFVATTTTTSILLICGTSVDGQYAEWDNISVKLADADRSVNNNGLQVNGTITKTAVATGADLVAYSGFSASNYLEQPYNSDLDFGTGDFSVMGWVKSSTTGYVFNRNDAESAAPIFDIYLSSTTVRYRLGSVINTDIAHSFSEWTFVCFTRTSNAVGMYVNGQLKASSTATTNLTNVGATTFFGRRNGGGAELTGGSLALLRISATAPTAAQIKEIYEAEKPLFQENAKATLNGTSDAVQCLAYDDSTELLHVGTSGGRSTFQGLRRVDETATNTTEISAQGGMIIEETA